MLQIGQIQTISIADTSETTKEVDATVTEIQLYGVGNNKCTFVRYNIPGYGETQPYMYGGGISTNQSDARIARSQMPSQYMDKTMADFNWYLYGDFEKTQEQRQIVNAFIDNFRAFDQEGRGLYIFSKTKGSGKTYLACIITNELVRKFNYPVRFVTAADFVEIVKDKTAEGQAALNDLYKCRILVFDDIGTQDDKQGWINEALFRLIDNRYREKRPVIFTSNCSIDKLQCDERVADRIDAMSVPLIMPEVRVRHNQAQAETQAFLRKVLKGDKK